MTNELVTLRKRNGKHFALPFLQNDLNNKISSLPPIELIVTWPAMEDALKGIYKETTVSTVVSHNGMQTAPMTDVSRGLE